MQRGTIAHELTVGLKAPLWDYQADSYSGGSQEDILRAKDWWRASDRPTARRPPTALPPRTRPIVWKGSLGAQDSR